MRDNQHATFLHMAVFFWKRKWIVDHIEAFKKIFNVEISTIKVGRHTWYKQNLGTFTLNIYSMLVHVEYIVFDMFSRIELGQFNWLTAFDVGVLPI